MDHPTRPPTTIEVPTSLQQMIDGVANGDADSRNAFVRRFQGTVKAFLVARWRHTRFLDLVDDAAQDVFLECFRSRGALSRFDRRMEGRFLTYFYAVVRNVARRLEDGTRKRWRRWTDLGTAEPLDPVTPVENLERTQARRLVEKAMDLHLRRARKDGDRAVRRTELLDLRCGSGLPIRAIAARWNVASAFLHHEYARARKEFKAALEEVVAPVDPGGPHAIEHECRQLRATLGAGGTTPTLAVRTR